MQQQADEDAKWMLQVARGDRAAFAKLFDRHQQRVVRFCHRFVGDQSRAEELAQDVFVKLYRSADRYQQTARFQTFLFRVATNTCLPQRAPPARARGREGGGASGRGSDECAGAGELGRDA